MKNTEKERSGSVLNKLIRVILKFDYRRVCKLNYIGVYLNYLTVCCPQPDGD